jgi:hypothetical protein
MVNNLSVVTRGELGQPEAAMRDAVASAKMQDGAKPTPQWA